MGKITQDVVIDICLHLRNQLHVSLNQDLKTQLANLKGAEKDGKKNKSDLLECWKKNYESKESLISLWSRKFKWIEMPKINNREDENRNDPQLPQRIHGAGICYATKLFKKLGVENEKVNEQKVIKLTVIESYKIELRKVCEKCFIKTTLSNSEGNQPDQIIKDLGSQNDDIENFECQLSKFKIKYVMVTLESHTSTNWKSCFELYKEDLSVLYAPIKNVDNQYLVS
jgi:hypothetical protein